MAAANRNPDEIYRHSTGMIECTVIGMRVRWISPVDSDLGVPLKPGPSAVMSSYAKQGSGVFRDCRLCLL
jgi:hypothetical protein